MEYEPLMFTNNCNVVFQRLGNLQALNIAFCIGIDWSKWKGLSVEAMLREKQQSTLCLTEFKHEPVVVVPNKITERSRKKIPSVDIRFSARTEEDRTISCEKLKISSVVQILQTPSYTR